MVALGSGKLFSVSEGGFCLIATPGFVRSGIFKKRILALRKAHMSGTTGLLGKDHNLRT